MERRSFIEKIPALFIAVNLGFLGGLAVNEFAFARPEINRAKAKAQDRQFASEDEINSLSSRQFDLCHDLNATTAQAQEFLTELKNSGSHTITTVYTSHFAVCEAESPTTTLVNEPTTIPEVEHPHPTLTTIPDRP